MEYILWLVAVVIFCILELISTGMTCIWFAVGSLAAALVSFLGGGWILQSITFVVVTALVLIFFRPLAVKHINNKAEKTNVESMIGKIGKVTKSIDNISAVGTIIVDGMEWTARSEDNTLINEGKLVEVVSIEGVKAIVKLSEKK